MPIILYILLALVLLLFVSGGYVFVIGCVRRKDFPWLDEKEIKKTSYGKYYAYMRASDQWFQDHNAQDIYVESFDGLKLHGLWVPADNPKGTVLLAHGYRSTILIDFYVAYDFYHKLGLNLLIPEQRSHGKSEGRFITFGVKESRDMQSWLAYHNREFGPYPLILCGISMGASTVMYMADETLPDNVRGIIADCGFTSPKDILASVYTAVTHLPAGPSIWAAEWFARIFAGFSLQEKDTRKSLARCRVPVIMVHGTADGFVPCEMTKQGYDACNCPKELLLVENADHGLSFLRDPQVYSSMVIQFLKSNVEGFA